MESSQGPIVHDESRHIDIDNGTFVKARVVNLNIFERNAFLSKLMENFVPQALHDSGENSDAPRCELGSQSNILSALTAWALSTIYAFPILWLNGQPGIGKSTIMRTFADMLAEKGLLLASFFFHTKGRRNAATYLISTIAYQMCINIPPLRIWVELAIKTNPLIFTATLATQIQALIIDPLLHYFYDPDSIVVAPSPRIILIDALDECAGNETQEAILQVLSRMVETLPIPVAIVFASRRERHIRLAFEVGKLRMMSSQVKIDDSFDPENDIMQFYQAEFKKILATHPLRSYLGSHWPSEDDIQLLVHNSSGQFIYAATVVRFVGSTHHNPAERLKIILGRPSPEESNPLDDLYTTVFLNIDPKFLPDTLRVLGFILTPPVNGKPGMGCPKLIESFLGFPPGHAQPRLLDLEYFLQMNGVESQVSILHLSLLDFLHDRFRSGDFFVDAGLVYADTASSCINIFRQPQVTGMVNSGAPHPLLNSCFERQLRVSLQKATPTDSLRDSILSYDMDRLIGFRQPNGTGLGWLAPLFLAGLKESCLPDAESLFQIQFSSFRRVIDPILKSHWLSHGRPLRSPLLFVLFLALTPASPEKSMLSIESLQLIPDVGQIHILPGLAYPETNDEGEDTSLTAETWHLLSFFILETISWPDGLLDDQHWRDAITILTCDVFRVHSSRLWPPAPWETDPDPLDTVLPFLLNVSLLREDLITILRHARRSTSKNGSNQVSVAINVAIDGYLQRVTQKDMTHSSRGGRGTQGVMADSSRSVVGRFFRSILILTLVLVFGLSLAP